MILSFGMGGENSSPGLCSNSVPGGEYLLCEEWRQLVLQSNIYSRVRLNRKMSVCSSGVQRRKKLENKKKFTFDEKDVVPPPRAATIKPSSIQVHLTTFVQFYVPVS